MVAVLVVAVALAAWLARPKVEGAAAAVEYRPAAGSFAATAPLIRGYNMPASMSEELWRVITSRRGFNVYEGSALPVASVASAAAEYRPAAGSFAATAPLIRGYNMPASMSEELWSVITSRRGFNVYESSALPVASVASAAVEYRPAEGSFAATAPLIRGYNMPASMSEELWGVIKGRAGFNVYEGGSGAALSEASAATYSPAEGGFAATAPLIPGYTMPHGVSLELWGVIKGRDGFSVYDPR
jgi:hypothetical protein